MFNLASSKFTSNQWNKIKDITSSWRLKVFWQFPCLIAGILAKNMSANWKVPTKRHDNGLFDCVKRSSKVYSSLSCGGGIAKPVFFFYIRVSE